MNTLKRLFKYRVVAPDCPEGKVGAPLLTRFFLFRRECFGVFLHRFHRSDLDEFHDHPWTFITFLLSSGYWEHLPYEMGCYRDKDTFYSVDDHMHRRVWRRRFSILYRPAEFRHYVEIEKPTWTLVLRFRKVREWGFISDGGKWTHWRKFEDLKSRSICEDATEATNA